MRQLRPVWLLPCLVVLALADGCRHVAPAPLAPEALADAAEGRRLDAPEVRQALERAFGPEEVPARQAPWTLDRLTVAALALRPELRVARAAAGVADARVSTAGQRPNPTLSVLPQRVSNPASGATPWLAAVQLDWPIETAGKRAHRRAAAMARADAAELAVRGTVWRVRASVYAALASMSAAQARREHAVRLRDDQVERVALLEARVAAGALAEAVVAPERYQLVQAAAELAAVERQVLEARAGLAAALAVPDAALDGVTFDFPLARLPDDVSALASGTARRAALLGRSDVLALLAEYDAAEADLRLELARQYPDIHLGPGYEYDQGSDKWGLGLSIELPLMNQNQGGIDEALARRGEAAARFEALQSRVIAEVDAAAASLAGARQEAEQASRLVAAAARQRARVEAALASGASDRAVLLAAAFEQEHAAGVLVDAQERVQQAAARLEQAVEPARPFAPIVDRASIAEGGAR